MALDDDLPNAEDEAIFPNGCRKDGTMPLPPFEHIEDQRAWDRANPPDLVERLAAIHMAKMNPETIPERDEQIEEYQDRLDGLQLMSTPSTPGESSAFTRPSR